MYAPVAKLFKATSTPGHTERNVRLMATEPRHVVPKRQSEYAIYEEVDIDDEEVRYGRAVTSTPRTSERNVRLMAPEPRHLVPKRQSDYTVYEELVVDDEGVRDERAVRSRPKILDKNVRLKVIETEEPVARMQPKNAVYEEVDVDGEGPGDERARFLTPKREERNGVRISQEDENAAEYSQTRSPPHLGNVKQENAKGSCKQTRRRSQPFTEKELQRLISMYCANRKRFHGKFQSGSKTGKGVREELLENWSTELSNMGIAKRTKGQIEEKLRNEVKRVQRFLRAEKEKMTGTGGGTGPELKTPPPYLEPLLRELTDSHIEGIPGLDVDEINGDQSQDSINSGAVIDVERKTSTEEHMRATFEDDGTECSGKKEPIREMEKAPTPRPKRSYAKRTRADVSAFTDVRSILYEEEIRLARMRQEVATLEKEEKAKAIEFLELQIAKARLELQLMSMAKDGSQEYVVFGE